MKRGIVVLTFVILLIVPIVSAGFFDFLKKDKVQLAPSGTEEFSVTLGNSAPTVSITSIDDVADVTPDGSITLLAAASTSVEIIFDVTDLNGVSDIDETTLSIQYTAGGEATRSTTGVAACDSRVDVSNTRTFTCRVDMQFYDGEGAIWTATVDIDDNAVANGLDTLGFTVEQLRDISLIPATVSFGTISVGSTNVISSVDTTVTNNGNFDVPTDGPLTITDAALVGETNALQSIGVTDFSSAATADFANFCGNGTGLGGITHTGVAVDIPVDSLLKGVASTEIYRHCIISHSVTDAQVYSTTAGGTPWTFAI